MNRANGLKRCNKTVKNNKKSLVKGKKQAPGFGIASKWYICHMIYGLNRYEIKKTRFLTGFSPFSGQKQPYFASFVAFERQ